MSDTALEALIKVENRRGAERVHLSYLKYLYNTIEPIETYDGLPDGKNQFISVSNADLDTQFSMLSGMLEFKNLVAIKMYQSKELMIVEVTNNA